MNILLVGAGAVGQVYGYHLQKGGAHVAFFLRPKAAAAVLKGMVLYPLTRKGERTPVTFKPDAIYTSLDDVTRDGAEKPWDEVWLCVPANALDAAWLESIAAATGSARVVALPPGIESEARIRRAFPDRDVVPGLIGIMSYQAPLHGEIVPEPGIAYYFPPGSPSAFGGPRGEDVAAGLDRGGCPAVAKEDVSITSAFGSSVLMPIVAGLEAAGWSLKDFRAGDVPALVARAAREAIAITASRLQVGPPFFRHFLGGLTLKLAAWIAPKLMPFDLEAFLHHHFMKVGDQTRLLFGEYRKESEARGLKSEALASLLDAADKARS